MAKKFTSVFVGLILSTLIPLSSALAFVPPSQMDDILKVIGKIILKRTGKVAKEEEIYIMINKRFDDLIPYIKELPDTDRIKFLMEAAEKNNVIKATDKIRINREIAQGKYSEDELISAIKAGQKTRQPINGKYAGGVMASDDLAKISPNLAKKYPNGVKFTDDGYPDFEPYALKKVTSDKLTGNRLNDAKLANREAGFDRTPEGYVWHHHQDCKILLLVPLDLHQAVRHSGGAERLIKGGERCPL